MDPRPSAGAGPAGWIDRRLPVVRAFRAEFVDYRVPANLNWLWHVGGWILLCLAVLTASGVFLALYYVDDPSLAFASVHAVALRVPWGWLIRSLHQAGAGLLLACLYLHVWKSLRYGSFKTPRELVWLSGMALLLACLVASFLGTLLPWGQEGYWAAVIAARAVADVPLVGSDLARLLRGGDGVGAATLHRAFVCHMLLGLGLLGATALHVACLHVVGPNNPTGRPVPAARTVAFHPDHTGRAALPAIGFLAAGAVLVLFLPGWSDAALNAIPADPAHTPSGLEPPWYLVAFYGVLRAVPGRAGLACAAALPLVLFAMPWLDRSPVLASRDRRWMTLRDAGLAIAFGLLVASGIEAERGPWLWIGRAALLAWFGLLFGLTPAVARAERRGARPGVL